MKPETHFAREPIPALSGSALLPVIGVAVAIAGILAVFWETGWSMVSMWMRSDTFTHGFVVAPISIWLVWRQRDELAGTPVKAFYPALIAMAGAGFVWLLGDLASVDVVRQLAMVAMVMLTVPAVAGLAVTRKLLFPIVFLFFAVPVGEFLIPPFIDWTADFTVMALQLTGIPVYREGNFFVIPSGRWSVVAGCSGVRYLIASFMVGTLFAHLTYRTAWRRWAFVGASIIVPIVANWLRAYMIVMLGHLSNNRIAVDVDHLIYGWVFFGVVIMLMFLVGSWWREDGVAPITGRRAAPWFSPVAPPPRGALFAAVAAAVAIAAVWKPVAIYLEGRALDTPVDLADVPGRAGWAREPAGFTNWRPTFVGARAVDDALYSKGEAKVGLYVAYYRQQTQGVELINSGNVLVTDRDNVWHEVARGTASMLWNGQPAQVQTAALKSGSQGLAVRRRYWVDGEFTSSEYVAKALLAFAKLRGKGDDSAAIVLYAPFQHSPDEAASALAEFVRDMGPGIDDALRKAASR